MTDDLRTALDLIPEGHCRGQYLGRPYRVEKTTCAGGRSVKLYGHDLSGPDFVSLNLYHLRTGDVLKPCEMPEAKVRAFVLGFQPDPGRNPNRLFR